MDYRWWYGNQDVTRDRIRRELEGNVKFQEFEGNIWSIRYENSPVFIAHMDTVSICHESNRLYIKRGKLKRRNSALGADDRAGVNLIMNHYKKINFIFTRDEELGRLGARELAKHKPFLRDLHKTSCVVELDCTGHKKIRGAVHGYCQTDLVDAVKKVIPDITDTHGSFSDLDSLIAVKPGVNLSVGYYKQHTDKEYLVLEEFEYVNSIILALNKELHGEYKLYVPPPRRYYHWKERKWENFPPDTNYTSRYCPDDYGTMYVVQQQKIAKEEEEEQELDQLALDIYEAEDDAFVCDSCDEESPNLTFVDTLEMFLCPHCLLDLHDDLKLIRKQGGLFENSSDAF